MAKTETKINFVDISIKIKELISQTANGKAIDVLVQRKADEEITRRSEILDKGMIVWQNTDRELKKCQEDLITHVLVENTDGDGTLVQQKAYSDTQFKKRANLKKLLADIEVALMLAFGETQDYGKLDEITKKSGGNNKDKQNKPEQTE